MSGKVISNHLAKLRRMKIWIMFPEQIFNVTKVDETQPALELYNKLRKFKAILDDGFKFKQEIKYYFNEKILSKFQQLPLTNSANVQHSFRYPFNVRSLPDFILFGQHGNMATLYATVIRRVNVEIGS